MLDKGAVVALPDGVEGFATPKHLVKEDGSQAQLDEKLSFKVIEFNKDCLLYTSNCKITVPLFRITTLKKS